MYSCDALKSARCRWSRYSGFFGSSVTASANDSAAWSHSSAFSAFIPSLKFFLPSPAARTATGDIIENTSRRVSEIRTKLDLFMISELWLRKYGPRVTFFYTPSQTVSFKNSLFWDRPERRATLILDLISQKRKLFIGLPQIFLNGSSCKKDGPSVHSIRTVRLSSGLL